jgi:hypothetical protein
MTRNVDHSPDRLLIAAGVAAIILVLAVLTAPQAVIGDALRARAQTTAAQAQAELKAGQSLTKVAHEIDERLSQVGATAAVIDAQGRAVGTSAGSSALRTAVLAIAKHPPDSGIDLRVYARRGDRQGVAALATLRAGGRSVATLAVFGPQTASSTLGGDREALILLSALALVACAVAIARRREPRQGGETRPVAGEPRSALAVADGQRSDRDTLVDAWIGIGDELAGTPLARRVDHVLASVGVERIDPVGQPFDPKEHAAEERVATDDPSKHNVIAATVHAGYVDGGRTIRLPKVAVYRRQRP